MSLLMQALKKAERAKQNSATEDELDKPSEAFDDILALTPEPAPAAAPAPAREFNLDGLSLEPMAPAMPAASAQPRPSPSPEPAVSDHKQAGLTLDLAPDPAAPAGPVGLPPAAAAAPTPQS
ncbi:tetratricopeptide repeat protein, partial [Duganella sp. CY15W]|nr:tetratricopeptide repeat protein [Duganella sp. CY15W]